MMLTLKEILEIKNKSDEADRQYQLARLNNELFQSMLNSSIQIITSQTNVLIMQGLNPNLFKPN